MAAGSAEPSGPQFGLALGNQAAPTSLALSEAVWSKDATLTQMQIRQQSCNIHK